MEEKSLHTNIENGDNDADNSLSVHFVQHAAILHLQGNDVEALDLCIRGTEIYSDYATGYLIKARILTSLKRYEEAIKSYRKVLALLPRCNTAENELQEILLSKFDDGIIKGISDSLRDYKPPHPELTEEDENIMQTEKGLKNEEELPFVSETLADIFINQRQFKKALEVYESLLELNPNRKDVYNQKIRFIHSQIKGSEG